MTFLLGLGCGLIAGAVVGFVAKADLAAALAMPGLEGRR